MYGYVKEDKEDFKEYMKMIVWEKLIEEEIIWHKLEDKGFTFLWLDTDEK